VPTASGTRSAASGLLEGRAGHRLARRAAWAACGTALAFVGVLGGSACSRPAPEPTPAPGPSPPEAGATPDANRPLPDPLPDAVARVNGRPIPLSGVQLLAESALAQGLDRERKPFAYRNAADQLIVRELLLEEALERGVQAGTEAVERAYDEARVAYKDDEAWRDYLAVQGMTDTSFRSELRVQLTVKELLRREAAAVAAPTLEEVRAFYDAHPDRFATGERVRLRHILVRVAPEASLAERRRRYDVAHEALERVNEGQPFAEVAREFSDEAESAARGGLLPERRKGQLPPALEAAAFSLEPGKISDLVETTEGFHILRVEERLPSRRYGFDEVRREAEQYLLAQRRNAALEALVARLRAAARIEVYL